MDQSIINLYDEYTHAPLPRRRFIKRLTTLAGGTIAANELLRLLENNYALAQTVDPEDPSITAGRVTIEVASGPLTAYLARPHVDSDAPGVIVIHENRGLNAHIEDVARRAAMAGFNALAVDLLSPLGGTPSDEDRARELIAQLDADTVVRDLMAARVWLANLEESNGKVGAVGFCWGGGMTNRFAVADPKLNAAVVFYGASPDLAGVPNIRAHLLLHYAEHDTRINATVPAYENALNAADKPYTLFMYDEVQHAFHNDTNAARYNESAAKLAWKRTIDFLDGTLRH